jgi:hypothetical protein
MVWKRAGYGSSKKSEIITFSMRMWQKNKAAASFWAQPIFAL